MRLLFTIQAIPARISIKRTCLFRAASQPNITMATTTNFDVTQTSYLFNWISNASSLQKGSSQQLADYVYCALYGSTNEHPNPFSDKTPPGLIPTLGSQLRGTDWQLSWGPGVYEIDPESGKADNTAYVVYSQSEDTYIIAIAGTDPHAFLDWLKEDFQVGPNDCVDWTPSIPTGARPTGIQADSTKEQISLGTALGIWALGSQLTLSQYAPTTDYPRLADYLQNLKPKSNQSTLLFTGHSLGGALSPTLARWAKENTQFSNILAMPTAGPTPGNNAYQKAWDTQFQSTLLNDINPGNLVNKLNRNVWNLQDVVPHAWQYIFTKNVQSSVPPSQQYYFSNASTDLIKLKLVSQIGDLIPGTLFRSIASGRQNVADQAGMTRPKYTTPFSSSWPTFYYDKDDNVASLEQSTGPYYPDDDDVFLATLGLIHVWGYGSAAFGLDFSIFIQLHPKN